MEGIITMAFPWQLRYEYDRFMDYIGNPEPHITASGIVDLYGYKLGVDYFISQYANGDMSYMLSLTVARELAFYYYKIGKLDFRYYRKIANLERLWNDPESTKARQAKYEYVKNKKDTLSEEEYNEEVKKLYEYNEILVNHIIAEAER